MNAYLDESSEPLDEHEYPDTQEDDDESSYTMPCPECGEAIYDDAQQCPYCGQYVIVATSVFSARPLWYVALAVLGIAATIVALIGLF